jgi:hypothetical protein
VRVAILICDPFDVSTADDLDRVLDAAGVAGSEVAPDDLRRIWRLTGQRDEALFDDFVAAVAATCEPAWKGPALEPGDLGLRVGHWKIDLTKAGVRAAFRAALVATVLVPRGLGDFTVGFVTTVLPAVFDIEHVKLSAGDSRLLVELRLKREIRSNLMREDELYEALPADTRAVINRYDFADFIERLREGGFAKEQDGLIEIWPS